MPLLSRASYRTHTHVHLFIPIHASGKHSSNTGNNIGNAARLLIGPGNRFGNNSGHVSIRATNIQAGCCARASSWSAWPPPPSGLLSTAHLIPGKNSGNKIGNDSGNDSGNILNHTLPPSTPTEPRKIETSPSSIRITKSKSRQKRQHFRQYLRQHRTPHHHHQSYQTTPPTPGIIALHAIPPPPAISPATFPAKNRQTFRQQGRAYPHSRNPLRPTPPTISRALPTQNENRGKNGKKIGNRSGHSSATHFTARFARVKNEKKRNF